MKRREFLTAAMSAPLLALSPARALARVAAFADEPVYRLGFGSCLEQDLPQEIWPRILKAKPDLFALIGDNIYADTYDMTEMAHKYAQLAANPDFAHFRNQVPLIATWDDHDYGMNDSGREYPKKRESKEQMLDFFQEPADSARRQREGIYTSYVVGRGGLRVQVLLLDLRWFRSELISAPPGIKGFVPNPDPNAVLLGEEQWAWLESQLRVPADVRILASSTQLAAIGHQWEKWENFPYELDRLLKLIDRLNVRNMVVISGDMHYGELSSIHTPRGIELFDLTSSGLNHSEPADGIPNRNRRELFDTGINFGLVTVRGTESGPLVQLELRDGQGAAVIEKSLRF